MWSRDGLGERGLPGLISRGDREALVKGGRAEETSRWLETGDCQRRRLGHFKFRRLISEFIIMTAVLCVLPTVLGRAVSAGSRHFLSTQHSAWHVVGT